MWRSVNLDEARRHPLYGFGGWLAVISILYAIGFFADARSLVQAWSSLDDFARLTPVVPVLYKVMLVVLRVAADIVLPILWIMRARTFRMWFLIIEIPATILISIYLLILTEFYKVASPATYQNLVNFLPSLIGPVLGGLAQVVLLYAYMWRSSRYRINFEHSVRTDR